MKWLIAVLACVAMGAGCGGGGSDPAPDEGNYYEGAVKCSSLVDGAPLDSDFSGCQSQDGTLNISMSWDCNDGRELMLVGDAGDPWQGWGYLGETFRSTADNGEAPLWTECKGLDD